MHSPLEDEKPEDEKPENETYRLPNEFEIDGMNNNRLQYVRDLNKKVHFFCRQVK